MKRTTKALAITLSLVMLFGFAACGKSNPPPSTSPSASAEPSSSTEPNATTEPNTSPELSDERLVVALGGEPTGLVDQLAYTSNNGAVTNSLYSSLVWYNSQTGQVEPSIASSWEFEDDCTVIMHLRDDVKAIDGSPITAEDVLYSFQVGAAGKSTAAWYSFYDVEKCEAVDDYTFKVVTHSPYSQVVNSLGNKAFNIMSKSLTEAAGGPEACLTTAAAGTGMYKLKEWVNGEYMVVERNDYYFGEPGYYKEIEFRFISDGATRSMALQSGDVDIVQKLAPMVAPDIDSSDGLKVVSLTPPNIFGAAINISYSEPMADLRVRQAIFHAINSEAMLSIAYNSYGAVADSLFPEQSPMYSAPVVTYNYDIEAARALMKDAGYENGFTVKILVNAMYTTQAEILQNSLKEIGITCQLDILEVAAWIEASGTGEYDIILSNFYSSNPNDVLKTFDGRGSFSLRNYTAWNEEATNALIDAAASALDPTAAKEAFAKVFEVSNENALVKPILSPYSLFGAKENLTNFYLDTQGDQACYGLIKPAD